MSISSERREDDDKDEDDETGSTSSSSSSSKKKKYVRIWRIEASREFILLSMMLVLATSVALYNPYQLLKVAEEGVDNTERIIQTGNLRNANLSMFINAMEAERKALGIDVINVLFLYEIEQTHKLDLLLNESEIPHKQYDLVQHNTTHIYANVTDEAITEGMNYTGFYIPFPMTIENMAAGGGIGSSIGNSSSSSDGDD